MGFILQDDELCGQGKWCTYQSTDHISIYVQYVYLAFLVIIGVIIVRYTVMLYQQWQHSHIFGKISVFVHILLIAWFIFGCAKVVINIVIFWGFMKQTQVPQWQKSSGIVQNAGYFQMFDSLSGLCLVFLFIVIPVNWVQKVFDFVHKNEDFLQMKHRKIIKKAYIFIHVIKAYLALRICSIVYFLIEPYMIPNKKFGCEMPKINTIFLIGESCVLIILYLLGYGIIVYFRKSKLFPLQESDYKRIVVEYLFLLIALLMRAIYNLARIFVVTPNDKCLENQKDKMIMKTIVLIIDHFLVHCLSVVIFIFIYRPIIQDRKRDNRIWSTVVLLSSNDDMQTQ